MIRQIKPICRTYKWNFGFPSILLCLKMASLSQLIYVIANLNIYIRVSGWKYFTVVKNYNEMHVLSHAPHSRSQSLHIWIKVCPRITRNFLKILSLLFFFFINVCHPGGKSWYYYPSALSFQSHCNLFSKTRCPIFKSVSNIWPHDRVPCVNDCQGTGSDMSGITLCMRPSNERWCYSVTPSLIG